jgi:RND family efflux transporter MFP subunit
MRHKCSRWYLLGILIFAGTVSIVWLSLAHPRLPKAEAASQPNAHGASAEPSPNDSGPLRVETVSPEPGGLARTTKQIGTVIAYESARLFAKIPGYLKSQSVDIGDQVKQGQLLAEIDAPELLREVDQAKATLEQTKAQVVQADAHVQTAEADHESAIAAIKQAEADISKTKSFREFRDKQYQRYAKLAESRSIEDRLVDEKYDELEAARAAEQLAAAGVTNARAQATAAAARIVQAKADAAEARSKVDVSSAALSKAEVMANYLKIVSPYDGVVTKRNYFRGDFIQSADQDANTPLLVIDRTDLMRVVVQVPDRDVPYANRDDDATVAIDALPETTFAAKVSRIADAEDPLTRTMRVEIDLPNDKNLLRQGMFGMATIQLGTVKGAMRIPSSCIVGDVTDGKGHIFVCRQNVAHLIPVLLGQDDGLHVEVMSGLKASDEVIHRPSTAMYDGARVICTKVRRDAKPAAGAKNN